MGNEAGMRQQDHDILLVGKVKAGDMDAFGQLVSKYQQRIYHTAYQITSNHSDADDLSQDAFIRAYRSIGSFDERSSFYTWLYRIAVNVAINHMRQQGRRGRSFSLDEQMIVDSRESGLPGQSKGDQQEALELKELHEEVTKAIDSLPLTEKTAVVLAVLQGLSHRDVAEIEGCSEKTISWRVFRARNRLKQRLQHYLSG